MATAIPLPPYRASVTYSTYWDGGSTPPDWPPTVYVGSGPAIFGDDSDDTYADFTNIATTLAGDEFNGFGVAVKWPALDYAPYLPAGWTAVSISVPIDGLRVRGRRLAGAYPGGYGTRFGDYDSITAGYAADYYSYTSSPAFEDATVEAAPGTFTPSFGSLTSLAQAGTLGAILAVGSSTHLIEIRVYDIWIDNVVLYASPPIVIAPPLRQFPRDDGLATSTARRFWPPPRSVQRGIRRAGHTYP